MKQTWKKIIGLILISVCVLAMTACGSSKGETSSLTMPDEASQQSLIESFGTVLQNISQLDEASIKSYMEGDDAFSAAAASAWDTSGSSLGSYVETKDGKLEIDDDTYVVTIDAKFEKRNADCVFILDKNGTPTSVSIDPVYSMGEKMAQAGQNTIMGIETGSSFIKEKQSTRTGKTGTGCCSSGSRRGRSNRRWRTDCSYRSSNCSI